MLTLNVTSDFNFCQFSELKNIISLSISFLFTSEVEYLSLWWLFIVISSVNCSYPLFTFQLADILCWKSLCVMYSSSQSSVIFFIVFSNFLILFSSYWQIHPTFICLIPSDLSDHYWSLTLLSPLTHDYPLVFTLQSFLTPLTSLAWPPPRFVNGAGYFAAVADAILRAQEEIFITDWWYVGGKPKQEGVG